MHFYQPFCKYIIVPKLVYSSNPSALQTFAILIRDFPIYSNLSISDEVCILTDNLEKLAIIWRRVVVWTPHYIQCSDFCHLIEFSPLKWNKLNLKLYDGHTCDCHSWTHPWAGAKPVDSITKFSILANSYRLSWTVCDEDSIKRSMANHTNPRVSEHKLPSSGDITENVFLNFFVWLPQMPFLGVCEFNLWSYDIKNNILLVGLVNTN